MICEICNNEITDEKLTVCPYCGTLLKHDSEEEAYQKWGLIYTTNTDIDADMYKANIEGAGIPVQILSQVDTTRMFNVGELAIVKIFVPVQHIETALSIINDINSENTTFIE